MIAVSLDSKARRLSALLLGLFACAPLASADRGLDVHTLRLEGAAALMIGEQFDRFDLGGGFGAGYEYRFIEYLGVGARYSSFFFPESQAGAGFGGYHSLGAELRLHPLPALERGDLWLAGGGDAVFTGDLTRFGLQAAAGFEFYVARSWKVGPFVRYAHVLQPSGHALGGADAGFLQIGISVGFSPKPAPEPEPEPEEEPVPEPEPVPAPEPEPEPEDDLIEVGEDHVETVAEREMREVADRILFPHGSDEPIPETLTALLKVARIINDHTEWEKITIEGHASDTGAASVNNELSRRRAERVRALLIESGVDARRIEVVGHGQRSLEVQGDDEEAHAKNRRVVFKVTVIRRVPAHR